MDNVGPDTGAENVASFIARRTDAPGSYHEIVDSDSYVAMMPDDYTAFGAAAPGYNSTCWHVSFACRTSDLNPEADWTRKAFVIAGARIAAFWERNGFDVGASAAWLPAPEVKTRPGLTNHGDAQPVDRSDAFARHPQREALADLLVRAILDAVPPKPPGPENPMPEREMWRNAATGEIAVFWKGWPWRVRLTAEQVKAYQFFGVPYRGDGPRILFDTTARLATGA
jgi:hypothetical protein